MPTMSPPLLLVRDREGRSELPMTSGERKPVSFDFTADLGEEETIVTATARLVRVREPAINITEALDDDPVIDQATGKIVSQWVKEPPAIDGEYRLTMRVTTTTGQVSEPELLISVPY